MLFWVVAHLKYNKPCLPAVTHATLLSTCLIITVLTKFQPRYSHISVGIDTKPEVCLSHCSSSGMAGAQVQGFFFFFFFHFTVKCETVHCATETLVAGKCIGFIGQTNIALLFPVEQNINLLSGIWVPTPHWFLCPPLQQSLVSNLQHRFARVWLQSEGLLWATGCLNSFKHYRLLISSCIHSTLCITLSLSSIVFFSCHFMS